MGFRDFLQLQRVEFKWASGRNEMPFKVRGHVDVKFSFLMELWVGRYSGFG